MNSLIFTDVKKKEHPIFVLSDMAATSHVCDYLNYILKDRHNIGTVIRKKLNENSFKQYP